jgi:hypothetical protein
VTVRAGLPVPFAANETNVLVEELVGSYLHQIHLHHELESRRSCEPTIFIYKGRSGWFIAWIGQTSNLYGIFAQHRTGTTRFTLAVRPRRVICKGDNQKLQPNYSSILGDLAAGGISNLYIPERDRHGAALTFENAGISLATSAAIGVLQEFVLHSHRQ